jgi:tRNA(adenine34) deaminase
MIHEFDQYWMHQALQLAQQAQAQEEVPVGAVLVEGNQLLAQAGNQPIARCDPSAHAEIVVLRRAGTIKGNYRFPGTTLYVTLEPCTMCIGALMHARIQRLVFGANDPRTGAVHSVMHLLDASHWNHHLAWQGPILPEACGQLLQGFFRQRR